MKKKNLPSDSNNMESLETNYIPSWNDARNNREYANNVNFKSV